MAGGPDRTPETIVGEFQRRLNRRPPGRLLFANVQSARCRYNTSLTVGCTPLFKTPPPPSL